MLYAPLMQTWVSRPAIQDTAALAYANHTCTLARMHSAWICFSAHEHVYKVQCCKINSCKRNFMSSAQQPMGLKLPRCCLNTYPALIQISFTFRSALSPNLEFLLHFQLSTAFLVDLFQVPILPACLHHCCEPSCNGRLAKRVL